MVHTNVANVASANALPVVLRVVWLAPDAGRKLCELLPHKLVEELGNAAGIHNATTAVSNHALVKQELVPSHVGAAVRSLSCSLAEVKVTEARVTGERGRK